MLSLSQSFPKPNPPSGSAFSIPVALPGSSPESTSALIETLKENHERYHIYFNDQGFHNHLSHHVLALWSLGATATQIRAASARDTKTLRPAIDPPEEITEANFSTHIGDGKFFRAYMDFFSRSIASIGVDKTVERWIFSSQANYDEKSGRLVMLGRFLSGLFHPVIHVGYGVEYGIPGMVIEGLAMTAVHPAEAANLIPESLFESNSLIDAFSSKTSIKDSSVEVHALTILARMMADEELSRQAKPMSPEGLFQLMKDNGPSVLRYLEDWKFDASDPATVNRKLAELHWALSLIYVSAWNPGELLDNDFFLMHLVTSSVFLPSFLSKLSPKDQWLLLTRHFAVALVGWLARGRRMVDIKAFFSADLPVQAGSPGWYSIIQQTFDNPDEHLPKLERALAHFASVYSGVSAGDEQFKGVELKDADHLDGSLFTRAAGLTIKSAVEGKEKRIAENNTKFADGTENEATWYWGFM